MTWQIALGLSILAGVARKLYLRRYSQRSKVPATLPPAASYLFGVVPIGLLAGIFIFPHTVQWSWWIVLLLVILSLSMTISNWFGFMAAGRIAIAPQQTIGMLTQVSVVLMGWTILGEGLTTAQFVGGGILLVAALIAIWAPEKTKAVDFRRLDKQTIFIAVVSAVLLGVGLVTEKALLGHMEIGGIFLLSWPVQTLGMLVLASKDVSRQTLGAFKGHELKSSAILGLANGVNGALYVYAVFHSNNVSLVNILGMIGLPLSIFGAYVLLGEREHHGLMWLSLAISFVGLIVMAM